MESGVDGGERYTTNEKKRRRLRTVQRSENNEQNEQNEEALCCYKDYLPSSSKLGQRVASFPE